MDLNVVIRRWAKAIAFIFLGFLVQKIVLGIVTTELFNTRPYIFLTFILLVIANQKSCLIIFKHLKGSIFKKIINYPPSWLFFSIGYFWFFLSKLIGWVSPLLDQQFLITLIIFVVVMCDLPSSISSIFKWLSNKKENSNKKEGISSSAVSLKKLLGDHKEDAGSDDIVARLRIWASYQQPIDHSENDLFGSLDLANQIAMDLEKAMRSREHKLIGLFGAFGSGKSSVIKLAVESSRSKINNEKNGLINVECIDISCWDFEESKSVEKHILNEIVGAVAKHVAVDELKNLPVAWINFVEQFSHTKNISKFLSMMSEQPIDKSFDELEKALGVSNAHLILIIEDLDRRAESSYDKSSLQRLLEKLKGIEGITILVAIDQSWLGARKISFDLERLCDKRIFMPALPVETVVKILNVLVFTLGQQDKESWNEGDAKNFPVVWKTGSNGAESNLNYFSSREFVLIAGTPRKLKHFITSLCDSWDNVRGEVNFFDFFLVTFINVYFPKSVRLFLISHMDIISLLHRKEITKLGNISSANPPLTVEMISDLWKKTYEKLSMEEQIVARKILAMLFNRTYSIIFMDEIKISAACYNNMNDKRISEPSPAPYWHIALEGRMVDKNRIAQG